MHRLSLSVDDVNSPLANYDMLPHPMWGYSGMHNKSLFLCEIVEDMSLVRPSYHIKDASNRHLHLAVYTGPRGGIRVSTVLRPYFAADAPWAGLPPGTTIAIPNAIQHDFLDGQQGIRLEGNALKEAKILNCSISRLVEINRNLCEDRTSCSNQACKDSNASAGQRYRCSACKVPYCSQGCQKAHWSTEHKSECKIVKYLRTLDDSMSESGL